MSDLPKLPFDPIPVGGAAVADPPRPSFTRTSTELPATGGLLPPVRKPVSVSTASNPLPPGIAAEAPPPNPAAGTPPPNPAAVGGFFNDLFRPTRGKAAVAAGLVSLFAGAYGLNLVMPVQVPTPSSQPMTETAKGGPGPSVTAEREPPKVGVERLPFMTAAHTEQPQPLAPLPTAKSTPDGSAAPAPLPLPGGFGGQTEAPAPLPLPSGFGGKTEAPAPLPAPAAMGDKKTALPWGGADTDTKPLPAPVHPFEKEKTATLPPLPDTMKTVDFTAEKPKLPIPCETKTDTAGGPLPKPSVPLPELPKGDAPLPAPAAFGDTAKVVSLQEKKTDAPPPLPAFGDTAKAAPLPGADGRLVSDEKKLPSLPVNTDTKPLPPPGTIKTDVPPLPAFGGFGDKKGTDPTFPPITAVGGNTTPAVATEMAAKTDFDVDVFRVRGGDTYATISEKAYGTKQYAAALQAYNQGADISRQREVQVPPMHVIRKQTAGREVEPLPATGDRGVIPASGVRGPVLDAPVQTDTTESLDWSAPGRRKPTVRYERYTTPKEMTAREVAKAVYADENEWVKLSGPRGGRLRADDYLPKGTEVTVPREEMNWK